jgi:hypothetical protein
MFVACCFHSNEVVYVKESSTRSLETAYMSQYTYPMYIPIVVTILAYLNNFRRFMFYEVYY